MASSHSGATSDIELEDVAEIIDRLTSVPVFSGSSLASRPVVLDLYSAARSKFGKPLSLEAFDALSRSVGSDSKTVLLLTGFVIPPWFEAEIDGPVGTATLARSLNLAWNATPVVVTEPDCVEKMSYMLQYAGLGSVKEYPSKNPRSALVQGFTLDAKASKVEAQKLLSKFSPAAIVAIEKASPNRKGVFHSGVGVDVSRISAKVDAVIEAAKEVGIPTVGIGDAGNEIGMGCIEDEVRRILPTGSECGCPCHGGVASSVSTDSLIVVGTSNWGASAIEALISLHFKAPELLHDGKMEEFLIQKSAELGYVNPASGLAEPQVDAIPSDIHASIVDILNFIVRSRFARSYYLKKYVEFTKDKGRLARLASDDA
jgi:D-glutamate cyclase